jgi:hypothetical protein
MVSVLYKLIESEGIPSTTFTYAMLAEMARIVGLSAKTSPPEDILGVWLYVSDEYYRLGHYPLSKRYFDNAAEALSKCDANKLANDTDSKSRLIRGFANMLDICNKTGNDETAKELLALVKEYLPSALAEIQKPKSVFISVDPVEYTERYMTILPELEAKVEAELIEESQSSDIYCFLYWQKKEEILKRDYGIKWESPAAMNPGVMFN